MSKLPFSQLVLERYLIGEVSLAEGERIEHILKMENGQGPVTRALEALRLSNHEIWNRYPPDKVVSTLVPKPREKTPRFIQRMPIPALAMAACLALVVVPFLIQKNEGVRLKGSESALWVYRQSAPESPLESGTVLSGGERVQVAFRAPVGMYAAVFSMDQRGNSITLWPRGELAEKIEVGLELKASSSLELDHQPGLEHFILVTSPVSFSISEVTKNVEQHLPSHVGVSSVEKEALRMITFSVRKTGQSKH